MVYGICRAMLRDVHEAEDATQEVFLSAYKALIGGATVRDPGGWLATIARNECRARIAAGMRRPPPLADEELDALPARGDEQLRHSQLEEIRTALTELPERQREAVVLRYLYGLRYGEVATALGLSRPATEALLFRARRTLRVSLRPVAAILVVPAVVREELALALPGFEAKTAPVAAGAGVAGGLLAKLTAGSAGVKVATAAVAVTTVSAVGSVSSDRPAARAQAVAPIERRAEPASSIQGATDDARSSSGVSNRGDSDDYSGVKDDDRDDESADGRARESSGSGSGGSSDDDVSAGPGSGKDDEPTEVDDEANSGGHGSHEVDEPSDSSGSSDSSGPSGSSGSDDDSSTTEPDDD